MAMISITLNDAEAQQLAEAARGRELNAEELATRWVRERLVHERERAAGTGKPMSPRARRNQGDRA